MIHTEKKYHKNIKNIKNINLHTQNFNTLIEVLRFFSILLYFKIISKEI